MTRQQVYDDITKTLGLVPSFFKALPDSTLEAEWSLFKTIQLADGPIPQKYRELMGVAISAATKCQYCTFFHTEAAKLNGATTPEIEAAVHYAKHTAGWSTYVNGLQINYEEFQAEVRAIGDYIRKHGK